MIVLHNPALISDPNIRQLVQQRFDEIGDGFYAIVVEPGDSVSTLEQEVRWPILGNLFDEARFPDEDFTPLFEVLDDHGYCYEMLFICNDDFGIELFIPKEGVDAELLAMCALFSNPVRVLPKDPLVADIVSQLDDNLREAFEERAAIIEYEANIPRAHAECLALLGLLIANPGILYEHHQDQ